MKQHKVIISPIILQFAQVSCSNEYLFTDFNFSDDPIANLWVFMDNFTMQDDSIGIANAALIFSFRNGN